MVLSKRDLSRYFSLISYVPQDEILAICYNKIEKGVLRSFATIVHDKDLDDSGNVKPIHSHILLRFRNPSTVTCAVNWFKGFLVDGQEQNTFGQVCSSPSSYFSYLTHDGFEDGSKQIYDKDLVISNNPNDFADCGAEDNAVLALQDLLNGVPLRSVALRYGKDFIYHYSHFRSLIFDITAIESTERKQFLIADLPNEVKKEG